MYLNEFFVIIYQANIPILSILLFFFFDILYNIPLKSVYTVFKQEKK